MASTSQGHPGNVRTSTTQTDSTTMWGLFEQALVEVPCLLDGLDPQDWANLAATQLGALEMVLRCCQCTMQVHPGRPLLYVLARQLTGTYCKGSIEVNGVRVPASDARALAQALREMVQPYEKSWDDDKQGLAAWTQFTWRLLRAAGDAGGDPLRVTALVPPSDGSESRTGSDSAVLALRPVLAMPSVRDHLQRLSLPRLAGDLVALLQDSLGELPALRRLEGRGRGSRVAVEMAKDGAALAGLISDCAALRELFIASASFEEEAAERLLCWLAGAGELRHLRLERCTIEPDCAGKWLAAGSALGALEVYEAVGCRSQWLWERAWRGMTNLQELVLEGCLLGGELATAIAGLLRNTTTLRRLEVSGSTQGTDSVQAVVGILSALQENTTVTVLSLNLDYRVLSSPLVAGALAAVLQSNVTLKHLDVEELGGPRGRLPNAEEVADALADNTTIETLRLPDLGQQCDAVRVGAGLAQCRSLRHLTLGSLNYGDSRALGRELARSTSLVSLEVMRAWGEVVEVLWGSGDQRSHLRRLSMRGLQSIKQESAEMLASRRCTLTELDLRGVGDMFSDHWLLAETVIPSTSLLTLRVSIRMPEVENGPEMLQECALPLLQALRRNKTMRLLHLETQPPGVELTPEVEAALEHVRDRVRISGAPLDD
ncbi:unnamed protein product [Pedinophyceae sp. YPF-701]|nr:unnamed protein product [Pedinophyceae sp. YPF-701]